MRRAGGCGRVQLRMVGRRELSRLMRRPEVPAPVPAAQCRRWASGTVAVAGGTVRPWLVLWRRGLRAGRAFQKVSRAAAEERPPSFTRAATSNTADQ